MEILLVKIIRSGFVEAPSAVLSGPDSGIIFPRLVHFFKRLRPFSFLDFICMADFVFFSCHKKLSFYSQADRKGGGGLIFPYHLIATVSARIKLACLH